MQQPSFLQAEIVDKERFVENAIDNFKKNVEQYYKDYPDKRPQ